MQLVLSLSPGGTERLVIEICKHLAGRVDSLVCCLDRRGEWAAELEAAGIPVIALGREPGFQPALAIRIARLIRQRGIQVVHCHHYSPYVYGLMAAMLTDVEVVFTEHGRLSAAEVSRKRRLVNPLFSRLRGQLCSVSSDLKQVMVAEGFQARRIQVVYNGIDPGHRPTSAERTAARASLGLPREALVVGTVGRLDPVKNLELFLQAHTLLVGRQPSARAVIIGDGPGRAALEATAARLGVSGSVTFAGYRAEARALMAAFDVYVNCSTYEGVSLTILEAMAAALPVVATAAGGNPEVVIDHETGVLAGPHAHLLAEALGMLARSPRRRQAMGDAGRWRVIRHFSIARMVDDYANAYLGRSSTISVAPANAPTAADAISVSEPTRSMV